MNNKRDTIFSKDSIRADEDTLDLYEDTVATKKEQDQLKAKVKYNAKDSIVIDLKEDKIYLYGNGEITYESINIKAAYIEVSFKKNMMYASGVKDSTGKVKGIPVFTEDKESFTADNMTYNFKSKKGLIREIFTKEGEGYLHGDRVKKLADNVTYINEGPFTTCDEKDPHYEIRFIRAKVIPDNKIVSGPAMLWIEGVPLISCTFWLFPYK